MTESTSIVFIRVASSVALAFVLAFALVACGPAKTGAPGGTQDAERGPESSDPVPYAPLPMSPDADLPPLREMRVLDEGEFQEWWFDVDDRWSKLSEELVTFVEQELENPRITEGDEARASEFAALISQVHPFEEDAVSITPPERFTDPHVNLAVYFQEMTMGWEGMQEALRSEDPDDLDLAVSIITGGEYYADEAWKAFEAAGGAKP